MTWVIMQCTGKCVTGANASVPEIAFAYRDPDCPLHGDAVADAKTLRESLRWVRGELRKADAENNAGRNSHDDRKVKFLEASLREHRRDEALYILSHLTLDELYELIYSSFWVQTVVGRHIMLYEDGVVPRHDGQRPEGHQD